MPFRSSLRRLARPLVAAARDWFEPGPIEVQDQLVTIDGGVAKGTQCYLPRPSVLSDRIIRGDYESETTSLMEVLVGETDVCFDIGGHYGHFMMTLASLAHDGAVHIFEPFSKNADRLERSIRANPWNHVQLHRAAVADQTGALVLHHAGDQGDDSMAYLDGVGGVQTEASLEHYGGFESTSVMGISLDEFEGPIPNFIKVDAEGAEKSVLQGGRRLLETYKPRLIVEVHGPREAFGCAQVISSIGYRVFEFAPPSTTLPVLLLHQDDPMIDRLSKPGTPLSFGQLRELYSG